jgi:hypothetical protein
MASTNMLPNLSMSKKGDGEGGGDGQNRPERIRYAHCQLANLPFRQRQQHRKLWFGFWPSPRYSEGGHCPILLSAHSTRQKSAPIVIVREREIP